MSNYHRSQSRAQPQVRGWLIWWVDTRSILALATPLIVLQCAQSGILFIDMLLMGRLGAQAIAGGALALSAFYLCYILASGIVSASGNLVAIAYGSGRRREVIASIRGGILLSMILSLGMGTLLWHSAPVMLALGQNSNTVDTAQRFLRILVCGMPFGLLFLTLRGFSAGIGRAAPVPLIMFSSLLMSGGLGWWLSKSYGVYGIAVASACTYAYMGGAFACVICLHPTYRRYPVFAGFSRLDLTVLPSLLKIGLPSAGTLGLESSLFNASTWLMGALSTTALAAHQSVMQLVITSFTVPFGLMYAVSMRVGRAAGAGDWHKVHRLSWVGSAVTLAWSMFAISILLFFPRQLLSLFLPDGMAHANEARDIVLMLIPLVALLCLLDGW